MEKMGLSKSKYCSGLQCPKILWLQENKPEEAQNTAQDSVMENGTLVGEVARGYFGDYNPVTIDSNKENMVIETKELMDKGADNITEASFITDGLYCAVDILHKDNDGWDIVEVKSSTEVKDIYKEDVAFQYYVLKECGINVKKVYILYINNKYVRHGDLNLKGLFTLEDLTLEATSRSEYIPDNIEAMRNMQEGEGEPDIDIDMYCEDPYECAFKGYCWKHIPSPSVFDINRLAKKERYKAYKAGIITFDQVAISNIKLSDKQKKQVDFALNHRPDYINKKKIQAFLDTLTYPLYHLDFETFQQAIPEWEGGKPYVQIPFQYSLHIEHEDGRLEHKEFLGKEGEDPRRAIAESLCKDIPIGVCSLAYNMSFEQSRLKELAELYPDLSDHLLDIRANMKDIMVPFRDGDYYSEAMKGSYSIKYVLPALYPDDPELDYHNLDEVHNGGEASSAFLTMAKKSLEEIASLRTNLLKYCGLDTYAMVKVLQKLKDAVN